MHMEYIPVYMSLTLHKLAEYIISVPVVIILGMAT